MGQQGNRIEFGDCRETMRRWAAEGVEAQMCVTSPPYFGLRSYDETAVCIDPNLDADKRQWLESELERRGIYASR